VNLSRFLERSIFSFSTGFPCQEKRVNFFSGPRRRLCSICSIAIILWFGIFFCIFHIVLRRFLYCVSLRVYQYNSYLIKITSYYYLRCVEPILLVHESSHIVKLESVGEIKVSEVLFVSSPFFLLDCLLFQILLPRSILLAGLIRVSFMITVRRSGNL